MDIFETPVSLSILTLIVVLSLVGFKGKEVFLEKYSLNPYSIFHYKKYFQLISHIFLHLDFAHLIFNALTFYFFAPKLELTIGSEFLGLLFLSAGVVSSVPSLIKHKNNPNYYSLGASGAISGVVFSFILFFPNSRIYVFFFPIGIPAPLFALLYLGYCIYASKYQYTNVNHDAHFWGAIWGLIFTILYYPKSIEYFIERLNLGF